MFGVPNAESLCCMEGRIDWRQTMFTPAVFFMVNAPRSAVISMRLPPDVKARFAALTARHQLPKSVLLARLIAQLAALGRQLRLFDMPNTLAELAVSALRDLLAHVRHDIESARSNCGSGAPQPDELGSGPCLIGW